MELSKTNLKHYNELIPEICPFDTIMFRGGDNISDLIAMLEKYELSMNTFTHIGMVVTSDILPKCIVENGEFILDHEKLYILESTFSYNVPGFVKGVNDISTNKGKFGVQLRELEQIIPSYIQNEKTKVAWCELINNPYRKTISDTEESLTHRRLLLRDKFTVFFEDYHSRNYEMDPLGLLSAMFIPLRPIRDFRDSFYTKLWRKISKKQIPIVDLQFCSELVANAYQCIGILDENVVTKNVLPMDFFGNDRLKKLVNNPIYFRDWNDNAVQYKL